MQIEIDSLNKLGAWQLVPIPEDRKVIKTKRAYDLKRDEKRIVARHKARLVANEVLTKFLY